MDQQCEGSELENFIFLSKPKESDIAQTAPITSASGWLKVTIDVVPEPQHEQAPNHMDGKDEEQENMAPTGIEPPATTSVSPTPSVTAAPPQQESTPSLMGGGGDATQKTTETVAEHDVPHVPPSAGNATAPDGHKLADGSKSLGQHSGNILGYVREFFVNEFEKFSKGFEKLPPTTRKAFVFINILLLTILLITSVSIVMENLSRRDTNVFQQEDLKDNIMAMKGLITKCIIIEFMENGGGSHWWPVLCADHENRFKREFESLLNFRTVLELMAEQDWLMANRNMWRISSGGKIHTEGEKVLIPDIIYYLENKGLLTRRVFDRSRYDSIFDCWNDPLGTVDCIKEIWAPKF